MKTTFSTIDVKAVIDELQDTVVGLRVVQVYDVDHKTYLLKLQKPDVKKVLLLESAARIHTTEYEWPKSPAPSGFSMKLRKHLRNKRIESIRQLGVDRIVDFTLGSGDVCHHLIIELYDRGNIVLTDQEYNILNILRPRTDGEDVRFIVREKYPVESARLARDPPTLEQVTEALGKAKDNTMLRKIFNPLLDCGGGILENELLLAGFPAGAKYGQHLKAEDDLTSLLKALSNAQEMVKKLKLYDKPQGFIIKKVEHRQLGDGKSEEVGIYQEFHPQLYAQHTDLPHEDFLSFNQACDEFFCKMETVKIDQRAMVQEREALKKLENVKRDHQRRLHDLHLRQQEETHRGQLIELNKQLVEGALLVVRSAIANQIDWRQIRELLAEAQSRGDPVACAIRDLKLETNTIILLLSNPYDYDEDDLLLDSDEEREEGKESDKMRPVTVDIDLDLSALANARKFYNNKRQAAKKEQKTIDASEKAIKSTVKKTQQTLKEVAAITNINKARKVHWFEKFLWFVSSENYLAIAGRDGQQNEIVVKRHLRPRDVYVHADLHGAASVVIKNPGGGPVPPRTLHEAGIMALCYSRAWDEKVVTSAWWVWGDQVSKTAPSGEYLTTGAFMVRGKKNFLPPSHLVYGFGFLFRLEESFIARHAGERKVRTHDGTGDVSAMITAALDTLNMDKKCPIEEEEEEDQEDNNPPSPNVPADGKIKKEHIKGEKEDEDDDDDDDDDSKEVCDDDDNDDEDDDESSKVEPFPDTVVEMTHLQGDQFTVKARTVSTTSYVSQVSQGGAEDDEGKDDKVTVFLGDDQPLVITRKSDPNKGKTNKKKSPNDDTMKQPTQQQQQQQQQNKQSKKKVHQLSEGGGGGGGNNEGNEDQGSSEAGNGGLKRGQRGKLKKMKKYRHQDEEERVLRMQLLQSSGNQNNPKDKKKGKGKDVKKYQNPIHGKSNQEGKNNNNNKSDVEVVSAPSSNVVVPEGQNKPSAENENLSNQPSSNKPNEAKVTKNEDEELEEEEAIQIPDDLNILNALTALPLPDDELLYVVPVCAPYTSMTNYKYKVKLTPGPGKKGKACKTALTLFLGDKNTTSREKDLLRAVRDHDLAKNLPGKVKVSAPNITKIRK